MSARAVKKRKLDGREDSGAKVDSRKSVRSSGKDGSNKPRSLARSTSLGVMDEVPTAKGPNSSGSTKRKTSNQPLAKQIETLETSIKTAVESGASLNALVDLIKLARSSSDPELTHKAVFALYRTWTLIIANGKLGVVEGEGEAVKVVRQWLNERLNESTDFLCGLLKDDQKALRTGSLQILMSLLKNLSIALSSASRTPQIHHNHLRKLVHALLVCPPSARPDNQAIEAEAGILAVDVRDLFLDTWLSVDDDIRWFFLRESSGLLRPGTDTSSLTPHTPENLLSLLERLKTFPTDSSELNSFYIPPFASKPPKTAKTGNEDDEDDEDDWRAYFDTVDTLATITSIDKGPAARVHKLSTAQSLHSLQSHRAQFTACWLHLLSHLSSSPSLSLRALSVLHRGVIPHLNRPVRLMDWISGCVDFGGSIGLLALNALFTLIRDYNLDYPDFYTRLYAFLTRDVLHLKHRARFFRLTELFLSSTHLPVALLASFVKRLSRLSLHAPPAAIVMVIPFVYNILKRHPALMVLIHREPADVDLADMEDTDPFDPLEPSPLLTNALSSSLWELQTHTHHYVSSVSTMARIFGEAFTKPSYAMEDFLDHGYGTLFETEARRRIKTDPATTMEIKITAFPLNLSASSPNDVATDVVSELWRF